MYLGLSPYLEKLAQSRRENLKELRILQPDSSSPDYVNDSGLTNQENARLSEQGHRERRNQYRWTTVGAFCATLFCAWVHCFELMFFFAIVSAGGVSMLMGAPAPDEDSNQP